MKKGIVKVLYYYGAGIALTALVYFVFGAARGHYFGPWFYVAILTLLIGLFWMFSTLGKCFFMGKTDERLGIILSHVGAIIGTFVFFYLLMIIDRATIES